MRNMVVGANVGTVDVDKNNIAFDEVGILYSLHSFTKNTCYGRIPGMSFHVCLHFIKQNVVSKKMCYM